MKQLNYKKILSAIYLLTYLVSCTKVIDIGDLPQPEATIVVEGAIANGTPPTIILTRNSSFFGGINPNDLSAFFVHDADVKIWNQNDTIQLTEFCINQLPPALQRELAENFGIRTADSIPIPNICIYTVPNAAAFFLNGDTTGIFVGKELNTYNLKIEAEGKILTAQTFIPGVIPLDPLTLRFNDDPKKDSLVSVIINFTDPDTLGNFFRYATKRNDEPFFSPRLASVFDDRLVNGNYINLPLERGTDPQSDFDLDQILYFYRGDDVTIKFNNITKPCFDFWLTVEEDDGDSPFSSPIKIKSNINGGIGIWCGYAQTFTNITIPE